jgi:ABC-2 type transport system permease protein
MRLFAEEKRIGSFETLLTLPVTPLEIVSAKFAAGFLSSASLFVPTLFYVVTAASFGKIDAGPVIGGYLGALFLTAAFTSIGLFASSLTKNQIIAFFIAFAVCALLSFVSAFLVLFPSPVVSVLSFFSATAHFDSISRGIIDTRDLLYFLSVTAVFFGLTVKSIQNGMRG